jgi:DNA-binding CsgD family transcriptional regulator
MRRARVEYTLIGSRLTGTVTFPGRPPQSFETATELERCLTRGVGGLVLVDSSLAHSDELEGLAALTPTEQAIAERAATGASNREIADALYYSVKSVEAYLTRIYRRLGVEGREGLSALVGAEDLEPLRGDGELVGGGFDGAGSDVPRTSVVVELFVA